MSTKASDQLVEAMPQLDEVAEKLKLAFAPLVGEDAPRPVKDALVGTWLGHPLHPAVVLLPLGFWTSSLVLDLVGEERSADLLLALGLASTAPAMATGAAQWYDATNSEKPRRLGALHAAINTVGAGLYGISLLARRRGNRGMGIAFSTAGYAVVNVGALLGGDLAYDLGVGVDHAAFESPPKEWTEVLDENELELNMPTRVDLDDASVMLLKHDHGIHAIGAVCPHLGGPLDEGETDGETVTCPWHGSRFSVEDGKLLNGPATMPVVAYEVKVDQGRVSIRSTI